VLLRTTGATPKDIRLNRRQLPFLSTAAIVGIAVSALATADPLLAAKDREPQSKTQIFRSAAAACLCRSIRH
jgi:hypothetical protein